MDMNTAEGRCQAICWIAGAVMAIVVYVLLRPALAILLALLIALVLGVVLAAVLMRVFCLSKRGEAPSETLSPDAVAAPAAAPAPGAGVALAAGPAAVEPGLTGVGAPGAVPAASVMAGTVPPATDEDELQNAPQPARMPDIADPVAPDPVPAVAEDSPGVRPAGLDAPRNGQGDDLKRIKGVGPKLQQLCNELGFWHFDQIAAWTLEEVAWVDSNLVGFKGRVSRDAWVSQARLLAEGGETEFSKRVDKGDVY